MVWNMELSRGPNTNRRSATRVRAGRFGVFGHALLTSGALCGTACSRSELNPGLVDAAVGGVSGQSGSLSSGGRPALGTGGAPSAARGGSVFVSGGNASAGGGAVPSGGAGAAGAIASGGRACGTLIDDMEDGSGRICTGEGRIGAWYVFNDDQGSQWPEKTAPGVPIETALIPGTRAGSVRAIHTYGAGFTRWGSGVGFDLRFDGTRYGLYDATRYTGVRFWARGGPGDLVRFRVSSQATTATLYGGTCDAMCSGPAGLALRLGPRWVEYTVLFDELDFATVFKGELARLTNIQFKIEPSRAFDFWVDDVQFLDAVPNCCPNLPGCRGSVALADPALKNQLESEQMPLSCAQVCSLRNLSAPTLDIADLAGLECLSSLNTLSLPENRIASIEALAQLPGLAEIVLNHNLIRDLTPLSKLVNLAKLDLASNRVTDLLPLSALTALDELLLSDNALREVSPLANLARLRKLLLAGNQIQDPTPLGALGELVELDLSRNQLSGFEALAGLVKLNTLSLSDNRIENLGTLERLPALSQLNLDRNGIIDVRPLVALSGLGSLHLAENRVRDPSVLGALTRLSWLDLAHNQIERLPPGFAGPALQMVFLAGNGMRQIDPLLGTTLQILDLSHNQLTDLSGLSSAAFAAIPCSTRCGPLPGSLNLSDNRIVDLTPLLSAKITPPFTIDLRSNPLVCAEQAANVAALRARGVGVEVDCP
jgi:internalin A